MRVAAAVLLLACLGGTESAFGGPRAMWAPNGVPLCTLPDCGGGGGYGQKLALDGSGGAIVVYAGGSLGSVGDINAHHVTTAGERDSAWPVGGVPLDGHHPADQISARTIASDGVGGVFVVWSDFRDLNDPGGQRLDLYLQRLLANGQIAAGWPPDGVPICIAADDPLEPTLLPDGYGGVMVVWEDWRTGIYNADIYALRVNGDGQRYPGWPENGLAICSAPSWSWEPHMAPDGAGGFVVAWTDDRDWGIYGLRMNLDGLPLPGWNLNGNLIVGNTGGVFGIAPDRTGGAFAGIRYAVNSFYDVYVARITGDGQPAPGWPAQGGIPLATREWSQTGMQVIADGMGGVFLVWVDFEPGREGVVVQRVLGNGSIAPGWNPEGVRVSPIDDFQLDPRIASDGNGGVYIVFEINQTGRSYLQHLTANGIRAADWPDTGVALVNLPGVVKQRMPNIISDGEGGVIVAWDDRRNGVSNQIYVQRFTDDGPTPTQLSLVSVSADPERVELRWHRASGAAREAVVERRSRAGSWEILASAPFDASGVLTFEDRTVVPGQRYFYRLRVRDSDGESLSEEVSVDVPAAYTLELSGISPNPTHGPLSVSFTLPNSNHASIALLDIAGRRLVTRGVGTLGAGRHQVRLDDGTKIAPGIYWVRLSQTGKTLTSRAVVIP